MLSKRFDRNLKKEKTLENNKLEELEKIKKLANKIDLDVLYLGERSSKFDRMAFIAGSKLKEALISTETALKVKE